MEDRILSRLEKLMDAISFSAYSLALSADLIVTYYQEYSYEINALYKHLSEKDGPMAATLTTGGVYLAVAAGFYGLARLVKKLDKADRLHSFVIKSFTIYPYLFTMAAKHVTGAVSWAYS